MTKILLVEDESSIADNVRLALEHEGFRMDHVKTGQDALRSLKLADFSLIILDVGLPDQSGFELCKSIRKHSQIPILFLTARSEEMDKIIGFEIGGDDYLTKPFSPRELGARVKAILKRLEPRVDAKVHVYGKFAIDGERFRIQYSGQPLELSRYEYRLLEKLIRRPGVVFSRTQLMDALWDDAGMSLERTVDTHIKSIRAKLKVLEPNISLIETHRGLGYSLKES